MRIERGSIENDAVQWNRIKKSSWILHFLSGKLTRLFQHSWSLDQAYSGVSYWIELLNSIFRVLRDLNYWASLPEVFAIAASFLVPVSLFVVSLSVYPSHLFRLTPFITLRLLLEYNNFILRLTADKTKSWHLIVLAGDGQGDFRGYSAFSWSDAKFRLDFIGYSTLLFEILMLLLNHRWSIMDIAFGSPKIVFINTMFFNLFEIKSSLSNWFVITFHSQGI